MLETMELECSPYDEDCAQVGTQDYRKMAALEYTAMYGQLLRMFGTAHHGVRIYPKWCNHDFGMYLILAVSYDSLDAAAVKHTMTIEEQWPAKWDNMAREELRHNNYRLTNAKETV